MYNATFYRLVLSLSMGILLVYAYLLAWDAVGINY